MSMTFLDMPEDRKAHWYFHPWFKELLQVFWLDIAGTTPSSFELYNNIVQDYQAFLDAHPAPKKALLTGKDLMEKLGMQPGATIGQVLKLVHDAQVRGEIDTKKEALDFAEEQLKTL
jgi:tRNA nucleotidyltransferase/poly(A) polymerase